jgi:hypothetical protein
MYCVLSRARSMPVRKPTSLAERLARTLVAPAASNMRHSIAGPQRRWRRRALADISHFPAQFV